MPVTKSTLSFQVLAGHDGINWRQSLNRLSAPYSQIPSKESCTFGWKERFLITLSAMSKHHVQKGIGSRHMKSS